MLFHTDNLGGRTCFGMSARHPDHVAQKTGWYGSELNKKVRSSDEGSWLVLLEEGGE